MLVTMSEWIGVSCCQIITITDACVLLLKMVVEECVLRLTIKR